MAPGSLPQVSVLALGGTVAMHVGDRGAVPALSAEALVESVPSLGAAAELRCADFRSLPGAHVSLEDAIELARRIGDEFAAGADGVVVTQGTDTIEEVAFALDLLVQVRGPLVVTGAMRTPRHAGADGPANLLAAVQAATSRELQGVGCVVVMGDEIHAARFVLKRHTASPAAFASPLAGPIGWVAEGRPRVVLRPPDLQRPCVPAESRPGRVALVTAVLGDDGGLVRAALDSGYDGLVLEAMGAGHVPETMLGAIDAAVAAMPVVLASRTQVGELLRNTYGFPGSERDLLERGLISAAWLNGLKARILLSLLIGADADVAAGFEQYLTGT
jgi:L-asparaginase